jgi:hypothetical protein
MAADAESNYIQVSADDIDSQCVTSGQWFKVLRTHIALVGIAGSCLMVMLVAAFTVSSTTIHMPSAASSTNLMGLSPSLRSSAAAVNPSITRAMGFNALPGVSPFKKIALAAVEANNLRNQVRDVSMSASQTRERLRDEMTLSSADSREVSTRVQASKAQEKLKQEFSNADAKTKTMIQSMKKEVSSKVLDMPGITEPLGFFDPLGISAEVPHGRLLFFREVELKHGRLAMLATLGILVGEQFHPMFGGNINVPAYIAFQKTPLQTFWPAVAIAIAIPEVLFGLFKVTVDKETDGVYTGKVSSKFEADVTVQTLSLTNRLWTMKEDHQPGDWGFDPLKLRPSDGWLERREQNWKDIQTKELNNGRLAMIAATGMIVQELVTGKKIF